MSNLGPQFYPFGRFYHGTTANITDVVRPAHDVGKNVSEHSLGDPGDMSEGSHAFASRNDENYAWHAAETFHKNGRRPRVYEVEEAQDKEPGPWNDLHPNFYHHADEAGYDTSDPDDPPSSQDEWGSRTGWKVKNRIDIKPGHQGTFPQVNWNRFKDPMRYGGPSYGMDANHPSDEHVAYGLAGKPKEQPAPPPQAPSLKEYMSAKEGTYSPPDRSQRHQLKLF